MIIRFHLDKDFGLQIKVQVHGYISFLIKMFFKIKNKHIIIFKKLHFRY